MSKYDVARKMRNSMDHIHSQLANIVNSKQSRPTVFGSLSYFVFNSVARTERGKQYGVSVVVHFGNLTDKKQNFHLANPLGRQVRDGMSLFQFSAFDHTLLIDELYDDIQQLANNLELLLQQRVNVEIGRLKGRGIDTDALIAQPASFMAIVKIEKE